MGRLGAGSPRKSQRRAISPKIPKVKRKKSPSLSKLKKLLWAEISQLVRSWSPSCLACGGPTQAACHIVPANDGAATRFFLPNLYPGCFACNESERRQRGSWVYRHRALFGADYVDALYALSETTFQLKKHWVLEQIERIKKLRAMKQEAK
jgi:hypothetical protein